MFSSGNSASLREAFGQHYPPLLVDLAEQVRTMLTREGTEPERASRIAYNVAEHVRFHWRGTKVYISKGCSYEVAQRNAEICARYDGRNRRELALEYNLTLARIDQIIAAGRRAARNVP